MNLTEQMLLRETLKKLRELYIYVDTRVAANHENGKLLGSAGKIIFLAERELSAILCLNCQESVNACQCEHTSAERAA